MFVFTYIFHEKPQYSFGRERDRNMEEGIEDGGKVDGERKILFL